MVSGGLFSIKVMNTQRKRCSFSAVNPNSLQRTKVGCRSLTRIASGVNQLSEGSSFFPIKPILIPCLTFRGIFSPFSVPFSLSFRPTPASGPSTFVPWPPVALELFYDYYRDYYRSWSIGRMFSRD
jgi:hypothetical protein